jgi:hypothetical protein
VRYKESFLPDGAVAAQFASCIEPVQGGRFSCPAHSEHGWSERVDGLVEAGALLACDLHHVDQKVRAQAAIDGHSFPIETIDELDEILRRANLGGLHEAGIAYDGEIA